MEQLGTLLGVDFEIQHYPQNGFQLRLTNADTGQVYFDKQMIFYTVWEAVTLAVSDVWAEEIKTYEDTFIGERVARALGIPETYFDD